MIGRKFLVTLLLILALTRPSPIYAQSTAAEVAVAIQLFDEARKLMAEGRPASACPKYEESQRRDPQLGTLLHLADCYERIGRLASAWVAFRQAIDIAAKRNAAGGNEPREQAARNHAARLEPRLTRLVVTVQHPEMAELEVRQDGEVMPRSVWGSAIPVDPGTYTIAARAKERKTWAQTVTVRPGDGRIEIVVPMLEDDRLTSQRSSLHTATVQDSKVSVQSESADKSIGSAQRTAGYVVAGLGAASTALGMLFGFMSNSTVSKRDRLCPNDRCTVPEKAEFDKLTSTAEQQAMAFNVAGGLGIATLTTGIILALTSPKTTNGSAPHARVEPWTAASTAGIRVEVTW